MSKSLREKYRTIGIPRTEIDELRKYIALAGDIENKTIEKWLKLLKKLKHN